MRVYIFLQQMSDLLSNLGKVHPHSEPVFPSAKSSIKCKGRIKIFSDG